MNESKFVDIRERTFAFAVRIIKLCQFLEKSGGDRILSRQLTRSGTSIGANLEEAQAGQIKPDFISKNAIALKESRETNYWLKLILETSEFEDKFRKGIEDLIGESLEITKIIASIIVSAKKEK